MQQFVAIALNGFLELARQPIVLLLTTTSAVAIVFLASLPYFGLGEDPKMVKDMVLAVLFLSGKSAFSDAGPSETFSGGVGGVLAASGSIFSPTVPDT